CLLVGRVDLKLLEDAFQKLVDCYNILRAAFAWKQVEQPLQLIHREIKSPFYLHDISDHPSGLQQELLENILLKERSKSFNLSSAPLYQMALCRMSEETIYLIFTYHPIILDLPSAKCLLNDLFTFYEQLASKIEVQEQEIDFLGYLEWIDQQDIFLAADFWKKSLSSFESKTDLKLRRYTSNRTEVLQEEISFEDIAALKALAVKNNLNLETLIVGLYSLTLYHYSDENSVTFGCSIFQDLEYKGAVRHCLPFRFQVSKDDRLIDWFQKLEDYLIEFNKYNFTSLSQVQEWIGKKTLLYDTSLSIENSEMFTLSCDFKMGEVRSHTSSRTALDIKVNIGSKILITLLSKDNYLDRLSAKQFLFHFTTLITNLIEVGLETTIYKLPLISKKLEKEILEILNHTHTDYPAHSTVVELFQQQVELHPDNIAIVFGEEIITYNELNKRANQLAHYLIEIGVNRESLIGLCMKRSPLLIVAILGILKAGGAYVPFDPDYPLDRLMFMLEDTNVKIVLTEDELMDIFPLHLLQTICLDSSWNIFEEKSSENPVKRIDAENIAYIMYTSGSTGRPKGVVVEHKAIVRLVKQTNYAVMDERETFIHIAPISFDASTFEIWGSLLNGAKLAIIPAQTPSLSDISAAIKRHGVTTLWITTSLFNLMVDEKLEQLASLKQILTGGEVASVSHMRKIVEQLPHCRLIHCYGPTESTTYATCLSGVSSEDLNDTVSIGRPISNTTIYILNQDMQMVQLGMFGEIFIGGDGLARGYNNQPVQTAEKFVPNPFSKKPGDRLYRTGDIARFLPDGKIDFWGRADNQVKVRGFRIELAEIETTLVKHQAIKDAIVTVRTVETGKQLVAYIKSSESLAITELRSFLSTYLPDYMIPSSFVVLESFPLTLNGKVDRNALPLPEDMCLSVNADYKEATTEEEKVLVTAWREVLGVAQVGIDDNFFELGGDSIRVIQVLTKVEGEGFSFSLEDFFDTQTVRALAPKLERKLVEREEEDRVVPFGLISPEDRILIPNGIEDAYPLAMIQMGMLFHSEFDSDSILYHEVFSYHLRAPFDLEALKVSIQELIARHDILRTSFHLTDFSQPLQLVHRDVDVPILFVDICKALDQEAVIFDYCEKEKTNKFQWNQAPLLRYAIHQRSQETFQFTITSHHIILDGWSFSILIAELFQLYLSKLGKLSPPDQPSVYTYKDYIASEQKALRSEEGMKFWESIMQGFTFTKLPRISGKLQTKKTEQYKNANVSISEDTSKKILELSKKLGVSLKSILLAIHLKVLSVLSNQNDVLTGMVSHSRPEVADSERIVGLFLNTVPFRLIIEEGLWSDFIHSVFQLEQKMMRFRSYPFAKIQQRYGKQAIYETGFNYTHFHALEGLKQLERIEVLGGSGFSEAGLTLWIDFGVDITSGKVTAMVTVDADEITEAQMLDISKYYEIVTEQVANNPHSNHQTFSIISEQEKKKILFEWNRQDNKIGSCRSVVELFELAAEKYPEKIAVVYEQNQLTYKELNERANKVASFLRKQKIEPETLIAISMDRSIEMIVSLLGVIKAGAAYLPIDSSYPKARIDFMLANSKAKLVLTQKRLTPIFQNYKIFCLDSDWEILTKESSENRKGGFELDSLAYTIYTSGSTGTPKGVMISHRAIGIYNEWMLENKIFSPTDKVLQTASFSFDTSVWDFFGTLSSGACLVLVREEGKYDPQYLVSLITRHKITKLQVVPSLLQVLLAEESFKECKTLEVVYAGGEVLSKNLKDKFYETLNIELYNTYGPTEVTIDTTYWKCSQQDEIIPIGYSVANTEVYILDKHLNPVPVGVTGELYIASDRLARGYLNCPDLTSEKFIPDHLGNRNGGRLYKTGDLARFLENGAVEFLGRLDNQVKIRGYRIELGEIEKVIETYQAVSKAIVTVNDETKNIKLIAYIVKKDNESFSLEELLEVLKIKLPSYMIPTSFLLLEALPLTPNGKIDYRSLPKVQPQASSLEYVAPSNTVEEEIVKIWQEVLGIEKIGTTDNFFDIGGHSIAAVQIISKLNNLRKIKLPISILFEKSTVSELAKAVNGKTTSETVVAIKAEGSKIPIFCIHPIGGSVFCYKELAEKFDVDRPVYGLQSIGFVDSSSSHKTIEEMASKYIEDIRKIDQRGSYILAGWSMGGVIAFEIAKQLQRSGQRVEHLFLLDSRISKPQENMSDDEIILDLGVNLGFSIAEFEEQKEFYLSLSFDEKMDWLLSKARNLQNDLGLKDVEGILQIYKTNLAALKNYKLDYFEGKAVLVNAIGQEGEDFDQRTDQWKAVIKQVNKHDVDGDHYSFLQSPHIDNLVKILREYLD
ncbi:MAG: amino acid adenylation domain-containing protein, partial [Blastocatellia bacterium]|nr:amino acid adenylation domain-containing protein [Blastocatellia bacterium]